MILPKLQLNSELSQFLYSLFVIILIPSAIAFNTLYLIHNFQRDMDFELNNKALLVESAIAIQTRTDFDNSDRLQANLNELVKKLTEIKAVEIFKTDNENLTPVLTTTNQTKAVTDPVLNNLAWSSNQSYSKQIQASVGSGSSERIWLVASPVSDQTGKKIGLINLYLSAKPIDEISNRTVRDSVIVLVGTMVVIILLLLNHFRFFEISLLFRKLKETDVMKDEFISVASHELRTPLTSISGYAYLLSKNPTVANDPNLKRQVWIIAESTNRLNSLVEDVLDVSKIEQKRIKFELQNYDLRQIIQG